MAGKVVLNLDQQDDTALVVTIDQHSYQFLHPTHVTPLERHRLVKLQRRGDELAQKADLTEEERAELESIPDQMVQIVVKAPDEIHKKLNDEQRMQILAAFMRETTAATSSALRLAASFLTSSPKARNFNLAFGRRAQRSANFGGPSVALRGTSLPSAAASAV
jgi:hypothetical protein